MKVIRDSKKASWAAVDLAKSEKVVRYGPGSFMAHPPTASKIVSVVRYAETIATGELTNPHLEIRVF